MPKNPRDLGEELQQFRPYLLLLARKNMAPWLQARTSPDSVVQEVNLVALRKWDQCGSGEGERRAWLRQILIYKILEAANDPDGKNFVQLPADVEHSSACLEGVVVAQQSSVSERIIWAETRDQQLCILSDALNKLRELSEDQFQVVTLHSLEGFTQVRIAAQLNMTRGKVAGLLHRGLKNLRKFCGPRESDS
jgi:RNA polymerase sigma-70 factor (ECF subfamily)